MSGNSIRTKAEIRDQRDAELAHLAAMTDDEIDTGDIPETSAENWRWGPVRLADLESAVCVDTELLDWFRRRAPEGHPQSEINKVVRAYRGATDAA